MKLQTDDREILSRLRICIPREKKHRQPRVLVPNRLLPLFAPILDFDGQIYDDIHLITRVIWIARQKVCTPYFNQATPEDGPEQYSCSTFIQAVFAQVGIDLPRYAIDQSYVGREYPQDHDPGIGDLVFFRNRFPIQDPDREIGHVGLVSDAGWIIHGSQKTKMISGEAIPNGIVKATYPFPNWDSTLVILPSKLKGMKTALDLARFLQRPPLS